MLTVLAAVMLLSTDEPPAIVLAREHLSARRYDEVLFAIEGQPIAEEHRGEAARILAAAAAGSLVRADDLMALQLAQMALRQKPNAQAFEVAAIASQRQQQFESAEKYADSWLAETGSGPARVFRASLAASQADWDLVLKLTSDQELKRLNELERKEALRHRATAQSAIAEQRGAMSQLRSLEALAARAAADAKRAPQVAAPASARVIVYSTAWCGYCKKAKAWLSERRVDYVEKDIEKDPDAARELAEKAAALNLRPSGVPVIDVRGTLVMGFDQSRLKELLGSRP